MFQPTSTLPAPTCDEAGLSPAETVHLEQLQTLGFADEGEYAEHHRVLSYARHLGHATAVVEAAGPWSLIPN